MADVFVELGDPVGPAGRARPPRSVGCAGQTIADLNCFQMVTCESRLQPEYIASPLGSRQYWPGGGKTMRNLRRRFRWALRMAAVRRLRGSGERRVGKGWRSWWAP